MEVVGSDFIDAEGSKGTKAEVGPTRGGGRGVATFKELEAGPTWEWKVVLGEGICMYV